MDPRAQRILEGMQTTRALEAQLRHNENSRRNYERSRRTIRELRRLLGRDEPESDCEEDKVDRIFENCSTTVATEKSAEDCRICFYKADHPIGCTSCKKLVGCLSCCNKWAESSMNNSGTPSCPLCRNKWESSDNVEELATESKQE